MAELPDPSTLTDEELDKLLETGQFPEKKSDEDKADEAEDEDKSKDDDKSEDEEDKSDDKDDDKKEEDEDKSEDKKDDKSDENKDESDVKKPTVEDNKDDKKPSRREQARIRDLLDKYGDPEAKPVKNPKAAGMDYEKELDADPAIVKKLEEDRQAASDESYNRGREQMNSVTFMTRLEIDAPRVEAKYPQLDKDSSEFKPEAATDVNLLYLRLAGFDPKTKAVTHPDLRYTDFVDTIFGLANDLAEVKVEKQVKEVKRQASQTAIRPDGSRSKKLDLTKAPEDMTDEELDAFLAQAIPKR